MSSRLECAAHATGLVALALLFSLTGCTSSKKTTTTNLRKVDSSSVSSASRTTDSTSRTSNITASDIDITYLYDTAALTAADSAMRSAMTHGTRSEDLNTIAASVIPRSGLRSVHVHIGLVSDSVAMIRNIETEDTQHVQTAKTSQLNQTVVEKKTVIPWWLYVAGGVLLLLIILIIIYKIVK